MPSTSPVPPSSAAGERYPELPALPGVDLQAPMLRLAGDVPLYAWMVVAFAEEQEKQWPQLRSLLAELEARREQLTRLAHTAKSQAATIGAQSLTEEFAALENLLHAQGSHAACTAQADKVEALLRPLLAAIAEAGDRLRPLLDAGDTPPAGR